MENNGPYEVLGDTSSSQAANPERRKTLLVYALCLCYLILGIAVLVIGIAAINDSSLIFRSSSGKNSPAKYSIVPAQKACAAQATLGYAPFYPSAGLPNSASTNSSYGGRQSDGLSKLFLNATLISMDPNMPFVSPGIDFLIDGEGAFFQIGPNMQATADDLIDLKGAYVTPGLIDMHSHTGVYAYPEDSFGTADGNEMTKPSLSQIRALDAFDASDPAIPLARAGGLTTVLVLPGSGDVMGGQAQAFKYRATDQPKQMFFEGARRGAKFACGENPKRVFGSKGVLPMSRMGIGWELRSRFFEAAAMTQKQDQWDCQNASKNQVLEPRPFALELETLQGILSGDVDLHNHCYEVQDLQMMMRTAAEFGFQIRCFHHGLEAWKIADEVAAAGIGVATFADHWGFKLEGYDGSVYGPKILVDAGVKMAIKTDHPVIPAWELMHEAAKTTFYGLTDEQAMASITTTPASLIGATRIGSIQERDPDDPDDPGFDADFVVWDRYPLELGARPTQVWVDGVRVVNNPLPLVPKQSTAQATLDLTGLCSAATANQKQTDVACYYVEGADVYTMVDGSDEPSNGTVVVVNGIVNCIGCTPPEGCSQVSFPGGVVIPGLVIVGSHIGLVDVPSESTSQDGTVSDLDQRFVRAIDGVRLNNYYARHLEAAFKANVLTHVVQPQSSVVVMGQTGAYSTSGTVITDATLAESVSLDITIGQAAKAGGVSNSISSQIAQLRKILSAAKQVLATNGTYDATDPIYQALQGELPIVLHSDNADEIATFIKLKQQFAFNLVLYGGAESFLVADLLASENVPVVLSPVRQAPSTFSVWNTASSLAATLEAAGVEVSIATDVMDKVRNIAWDAGIERAHGFKSGLKSITINPARAFGLDSQGVGLIQVGQPARFGAYTADPLTLFGHVQFVALGTTVICQPKQY